MYLQVWQGNSDAIVPLFMANADGIGRTVCRAFITHRHFDERCEFADSAIREHDVIGRDIDSLVDSGDCQSRSDEGNGVSCRGKGIADE